MRTRSPGKANEKRGHRSAKKSKVVRSGKGKKRDEDVGVCAAGGLGTRYFPAPSGAPAGTCQGRSCQSYVHPNLRVDRATGVPSRTCLGSDICSRSSFPLQPDLPDKAIRPPAATSHRQPEAVDITDAEMAARGITRCLRNPCYHQLKARQCEYS